MGNINPARRIMKRPILLFLVTVALISGCQQPKEAGVTTDNKPTVDSMVLSILPQFPKVTLPYHWNDIALQHTDYNVMRVLPYDTAATLLSELSPNNAYYAVATVFDTLNATAVVLLESHIDTTLQITDRYYLLSIDQYGQVIDHILLAAYIIGDSHRRTTGHVFPNGNITVESFDFTFTNGQWMRDEQPLSANYYQWQPGGKIDSIYRETDGTSSADSL